MQASIVVMDQYQYFISDSRYESYDIDIFI